VQWQAHRPLPHAPGGPDGLRVFASLDVSLRDRNSFHLDARADCLATVHDATALPSLLAEPALQNLPLMVLGAGSNVLFAPTGTKAA